MLRILIISEDGERLAEIVRQASACGHHFLMRSQESPQMLLGNLARLHSADALLVDVSGAGASHMQRIEALRQQFPALPCILITSSQQPDVLLRAIRAGVRDVLSWPLERGQLADAISRVEASLPPRQQHRASLVSLLSCKGGAGTSFIAANLAHTLATLGRKRVLLLDLNTQFADTASLVSDKTPSATLPDVCAQIDRLDDAFLEACLTHVTDGFDILAGASDPTKAQVVTPERVGHILAMVSDRYDLVVVDAGHAVTPVSMSVLDKSDKILVVTQPSIAYARNGRNLSAILRALHYSDDQVHLVPNRCSRRDELDTAMLEKVFGMKVLHAIPDEPAAVNAAISHGVPLLQEDKRCGAAKAIQTLSTALAGPPDGVHRTGDTLGSSLKNLFQRAKPTTPNIA